MKTNIKVLGWLHIALGILGVLLGSFIFLILMGTGLISGDDDAFIVLSIISAFIAALTVILSVPGIVAGIGLLNFRTWARVLALVLAFFNLFAFPHGTIFGVYTFVSLLNTDASTLFGK